MIKNYVRVIFFHASFCKTRLVFPLTNDAPSLVLLVIQDKMSRSLTGHGVPGTVKVGLPSKFQKQDEFY